MQTVTTFLSSSPPQPHSGDSPRPSSAQLVLYRRRRLLLLRLLVSSSSSRKELLHIPTPWKRGSNSPSKSGKTLSPGASSLCHLFSPHYCPSATGRAYSSHSQISTRKGVRRPSDAGKSSSLLAPARSNYRLYVDRKLHSRAFNPPR